MSLQPEMHDPAVAGADLARQNGLHRLRFARSVTLRLLEDVPAEKWLLQPLPGANHVMWLLGHLAVTDQLFLDSLGAAGPRCPEEWQALFARGTLPLPEANAYPTPELLLDHLASRREELLAWFAALPDAELAAPLPEGLRGYAANLSDLMASIAWHEGWHCGQLTVVRKALGLSPKFG
jgi:uncharacterized damage-inducible protein DinB